ncbi:uncharacterized protein [Apostichopus japonicus]|uniref:uncharacterized protein isoform X2 n=1 Tax=Stichopus japonicus TaxID=307972 RepID=UPI003AB11544
MASGGKRVSLILQPLDAVRETDVDEIDCGPSLRNKPVSPKYASFGNVERVNGHAYSKTISLEDEESPQPVSSNPPEYHSVPDITKRQGPQYQEIPYDTTNGHASPAEEAQPPSLSTSLSQQSDTEVDQALYRTSLPTSSSTVPLTAVSAPPPPIPGERRPRKKANPLYDSFGEVVTTSSSSTKKPPPSKDSYHKNPCRCIRHPLVLFAIAVFVILNSIALLLLFTGALEQALPGSREKLVQTTPESTGLPGYEELANIIKKQEDLIMSLHNRVSQLESLLMTNSSENATTTARVAQNTHQIEQLSNQVTALGRNSSTQIQEVQRQVESNDALITSNIQKTSQLESDISTLTARSETMGQDILSITSKNTDQDRDISGLESRIETVKQEVALDLVIYNDSIYMDLEAISKMQGPPGFNGSRGGDGADLSGCEYDYFTDSSSFTGPLTQGTPHTPKTGFVFTGVTCATYGGTAANLMKTEDGSVYCQCEGQTTAYTSLSRFCNIHYWQCPLAA